MTTFWPMLQRAADPRAGHDVGEMPDLRALADRAAVVDVRRLVHEDVSHAPTTFG